MWRWDSNALDLPNPMVAAVGNVEISFRIDEQAPSRPKDAGLQVESCIGRRPAVAREDGLADRTDRVPDFAAPSYRRDDSIVSTLRTRSFVESRMNRFPPASTKTQNISTVPNTDVFILSLLRGFTSSGFRPTRSRRRVPPSPGSPAGSEAFAVQGKISSRFPPAWVRSADHQSYR